MLIFNFFKRAFLINSISKTIKKQKSCNKINKKKGWSSWVTE